MSLSRCLKCSTVSLEKRPPAADAPFDYDDYYSRSRFEDEPAAVRSIESLIGSLRSFRESGRLLDIGFGEGGLLRAAERQGWSCFGAEVSRDALDYGQTRGWIVSAEPESNPLFPAGGFDIVTMIEFIEHVLNPAQFIASAFKFLRPGGALYLTTPNVQSLNARLLGIDWSIFAPPEHAVIWSAKGLAFALKQYGFKIQTIRADGLNPAELVARARGNKGGTGAPAVDRNQAAFALNAAFSSSRWRRAVKQTINQGLTVFRMGDSLKVLAQKPGP
ncbi:MAG TPA: class I SAM-dependent methyltransferase [Blastocatellia bacterium]|nr:class I SAM-dependent methyltransferase [Blastocatellia bacterium]